jgi:hypothetical protein
MKNIITEISRIKQMMGILENEETTGKSFIIDGINKGSLLDLVNWWGDNELEIYNDLKNSEILNNSSEELISKIFQSTPSNIDKESSVYFTIHGALMLSLVNGVKNDPTYDDEGNYVENRKTPQTDLWNKLTSQKGLMYFNQLVDLEDYENQNILNEFLEIIPGLKERVSNLKTVKKEEDTVLDDKKQNIENATTQNIENATTQNIDTKQTPIISADQYISKLNYSDVGFPNQETSGSMRKYAESLALEDPNRVKEFVKNLVDTFRSIMKNTFNKEISRAGNSESWAYWDIAKQLYMNNHPEESNKNYRLGNPLDEQDFFKKEIIYRMIGWEMTNGGKKPDGSKYSSWELKDKGKEFYTNAKQKK